MKINLKKFKKKIMILSVSCITTEEVSTIFFLISAHPMFAGIFCIDFLSVFFVSINRKSES